MRQFPKFGLCSFILFLALVGPAAAQRPQLQMQTGHTDVVKTIVYSPDGRLLASASYDKTVKIWSTESGKELRTFTLAGSGGPLCMSGDGKLLATGDDSGSVSIWRLEDGTPLQTIKSGLPVNGLAFSSDGRLLAGVSEKQGNGNTDNRLSIWNVLSGQVTRAWQLPNTSRAVAFSPDNQTVVTEGDNKNDIVFFSVATGEVTRTLAGHTKLITGLAFSSDGRTLASASWDGSVKIWDVARGVPRQTLEESYKRFYSVAFSPDDQTLVTVSDQSAGWVKVWRVSDGQLLSTLEDFTERVLFAAFSPDNRTIASATWQDGITLHNAADGRKTGALKGASRNGDVDSVRQISMTADGRTLASARSNGGIEIWDLVNSTMRVFGENVAGGFNSVAISEDGSLLAGGSPGEKVMLWDTATGQLRHTVRGRNGGPVLLSRDGRLLFNGVRDGDTYSFKVWDTATGAELRTLVGFNEDVSQLALSPDGQTLALVTSTSAGSHKYEVQLFNVKDGTLIRMLSGDPHVLRALAFSPDGRTLAGGGINKDIILWNIDDGAPRRRLTVENDPSVYLPAVNALVFSPDGKTLASDGPNGRVKLWDAASGTELRTLAGQTDWIHTLLFSPNGSKLLSGSHDGSIKVWSPATGSALCTMIGAGTNTADWIVVTPDGLFDGTPQAWHNLDWRFSPALYDISPVELFFSEFYYPNLLGDIMSGRQPRAAQDIAQRDRRQPVVALTAAGNSGAMPEVTTLHVVAQIKISNAPAGAQDVRLFRNGSLVRVWHGDVLQGKTETTLTASVPVVAGENRLTAYAFNRDNVKSSDASLLINGAESLRRKGIAYVLAVGVNSYANHDFDLKYAVADAQDFSAEWPLQQAKLKAYAQTQVTLLTDAQATKPAILKFLGDLAMKAKPEDAVVIYFAGHGTAQSNRFYLIPHDLGYQGGRDAIDEAGLKTILEHSISDLELQDAIETIDAGQLLMVIDACNSGQALESEEKRRGPMNSKGLAQLAYEKGMYILTAAQSYQAAQEASRFGHGFLTFALVEEGEKQNKADNAPPDGQVVVREWFDYATLRVPQMQIELMKEAQSGRGVKVAFIKGEEQIADPAARKVQRPRVFYRREVEAKPLVVAQPH
ncbi:MAG TPA: caspase family protein [Thermoanaerobaculia bacterium]|nr:caspase family protein [Thermoanaerobaculia bacterium]